MDSGRMSQMSMQTPTGRESVSGGGGPGSRASYMTSGKSVRRQSTTKGPSRNTVQGRMSYLPQSRASRMSRNANASKRDDTGGNTVSMTIFDDDGNDVTPKPMAALKSRPDKGTPNQSETASEFSEPITTSQIGRFSYRGMSLASESSGGQTPERIEGEDDGDFEEEKPVQTAMTVVRAGSGAHVEKSISEADLDKRTYLTLQETDTFLLLEMPCICVHAESEEAPIVEAQNKRYLKLMDDRAGADTFVTTDTQTLPVTVKDKDVQVNAPAEVSTGCQASLWDMVDTAADRATTGNQTEDADALQDARSALASAYGVRERPGTAGGILNEKERFEQHLAKQLPTVDTATLEKLGGLPKALQTMERALTETIYNSRLLLYRDFYSRGEGPASTQGTASLQHLWSFSCDLTSGKNISTMAWNKQKKDLLVVGYGQFQFASSGGGLIAFWSLKNPEYPEWTFSTKSGVTAVDFSSANPNLLAVGFYDGSIAIYDVRSPSKDPKPVLESTWNSHHNNGKHSDPVWRLQWGDRGSERGESLVSISTDGRVTQWSIKKGLENNDLVRLKRISRGTKGASKNEAFISRKSSGMCLDFSPRDSSVYVAGTEDGAIHKCSCSYAEQYLDSYFGHTGPVYQVAWSPFAPSLFLSCSADWTARLWSDEQSSSLLTFQSGNESVSDVSWSPLNSTVFGAVSADGKLEIWDLSESTLKPSVSHNFPNVRLSKLLFSQTSPVIVCGGDDGSIHVLRHRGLDLPRLTRGEQLKQLEDAVRSNIISNMN